MTRRAGIALFWCSTLLTSTFSSSVRALSLSNSSSSVKSVASPPSQTNLVRPHAIIVGAGPIGLATALTLANFHSYDVTVYEKAPYDDYSSFDPSKAFLYLISSRGQEFTTMFPELQTKLMERGVPSSTPFVRISEDINTLVPEEEGRSYLSRNADFGEEEVETDANDDKSQSKDKKKQEIMGYWIPRHDMNLILYETIQEIGKKKKGDKTVGKITCHFGVFCVDMHVSDDQASIQVVTRDTSNGKESMNTANLVVAGDGNKSKVREILSAQNPTSSSFKAFDSKFNPKKFKVRQWTSPSTALRLKALQLPPKCPIPQAGAESYISKGHISYFFRGKNKGPRNYLQLGCLPMKDDDLIRPANVVTRPDHDIWKLTEGEDVRKYMQNCFPRMQFQPEAEGGIISDAEWERFTKAKGLSFPFCQYSPGLVVSSSGDNNEGEALDCGVVLLGDAAHSFPPDTGQGINAGLSDVVYLDRVLKNDGQSIRLNKALRQYEKKRAPETKALIRLARFGFPYQYSQSHYIDRIRKMLCLVNFAGRILLNKVTAGLAPKPAVAMAMDKGVTYRQVMRKADAMTALFSSLCIVLVAKKMMSSFFL